MWAGFCIAYQVFLHLTSISASGLQWPAWRLQCAGGSRNEHFAVHELQLLGVHACAAEGPPSAAPSGSVSISSGSLSGFPVQNAFDGDLGTVWKSACRSCLPQEAWVGILRLELHLLDIACVRLKASSCALVALQESTDLHSWSTVRSWNITLSYDVNVNLYMADWDTTAWSACIAPCGEVEGIRQRVVSCPDGRCDSNPPTSTESCRLSSATPCPWVVSAWSTCLKSEDPPCTHQHTEDDTIFRPISSGLYPLSLAFEVEQASQDAYLRLETDTAAAVAAVAADATVRTTSFAAASPTRQVYELILDFHGVETLLRRIDNLGIVTSVSSTSSGPLLHNPELREGEPPTFEITTDNDTITLSSRAGLTILTLGISSLPAGPWFASVATGSPVNGTSSSWRLCPQNQWASCGEAGIMKRTVSCPGENCDAAAKPPQTKPCVGSALCSWRVGEWGSCLAANGLCSSSKERRIVNCSYLGAEQSCPGPRPVDERPCMWELYSNYSNGENVSACNGSDHREIGQHDDSCLWQVGGWSECTEDCQGGIAKQTRLVCCPADNVRICRSPKPMSERSCARSFSCPWTTSAWSACSSRCGGGIQSRNVFCHAAVPCLGQEPNQSRSCHGQHCAWNVGNWGACSATCTHSGIQVRSTPPSCQFPNSCAGLRPTMVRACPADTSLCPTTTTTTTTIPTTTATSSSVTLTSSQYTNTLSSTEPSRTPPAPAPSTPPAPAPPAPDSGRRRRSIPWSLSPWSKCSVDCGQGFARRDVSCQASAPERCKDPRPKFQRPCMGELCYWEASGWSPCNATCSSLGLQIRTVQCTPIHVCYGVQGPPSTQTCTADASLCPDVGASKTAPNADPKKQQAPANLENKPSGDVTNPTNQTNKVWMEGPQVGMGISGHNDIAVYKGTSAEECLAYCKGEPNCRSVDYGARGDVHGECWLSTADRASAGQSYTHWQLYDYYEKKEEVTNTSKVSPLRGGLKASLWLLSGRRLAQLSFSDASNWDTAEVHEGFAKTIAMFLGLDAASVLILRIELLTNAIPKAARVDFIAKGPHVNMAFDALQSQPETLVQGLSLQLKSVGFNLPSSTSAILQISESDSEDVSDDAEEDALDLTASDEKSYSKYVSPFSWWTSQWYPCSCLGQQRREVQCVRTCSRDRCPQELFGRCRGQGPMPPAGRSCDRPSCCDDPNVHCVSAPPAETNDVVSQELADSQKQNSADNEQQSSQSEGTESDVERQGRGYSRLPTKSVSTVQTPVSWVCVSPKVDGDADNAAIGPEHDSPCEALDSKNANRMQKAAADGLCGKKCRCCRQSLPGELVFTDDAPPTKSGGMSGRLALLKEWAICLGLGGAFIGATLVVAFHLMCCVFHRRYQRGLIYSKYYDPAWRHETKDSFWEGSNRAKAKDAWDDSDTMEGGRAPQQPGRFAFERPSELFIDVSPRNTKDSWKDANLSPHWADWSGTFRSSWSEMSTQASTPTGPSPSKIGRQASKMSMGSTTASEESFASAPWSVPERPESRRSSRDSSSNNVSAPSSPNKAAETQDESARRCWMGTDQKKCPKDVPHQSSKDASPQRSSRRSCSSESLDPDGSPASSGSAASAAQRSSHRGSESVDPESNAQRSSRGGSESPPNQTKKPRMPTEDEAQKTQPTCNERKNHKKPTDAEAEKCQSQGENKPDQSKSSTDGQNEAPDGSKTDRKKRSSHSSTKENPSEKEPIPDHVTLSPLGAVAQTVEMHRKSIDIEIKAGRSQPLDWRKKHFRQLLLSWHPDKNSGDPKRALVATGVFQHVQSLKRRYLEEDSTPLNKTM